MTSQADIDDLMPASSTAPSPTVLQSAQSYADAHPNTTVRYFGRDSDTNEFRAPIGVHS